MRSGLGETFCFEDVFFGDVAGFGLGPFWDCSVSKSESEIGGGRALRGTACLGLFWVEEVSVPGLDVFVLGNLATLMTFLMAVFVLCLADFCGFP